MPTISRLIRPRCTLSRTLLGVALASSTTFAAMPAAYAVAYTVTFTQVSTSNTPGAPPWRGWTAMRWVGSLNQIVMWGGSGAFFYDDVQALNPVSASWTTIDTQVDCPGNTSFLRPNGSDESGLVWDSISNSLW